MGKIFVGKYVKTHGIKGEIKIKSNINHKEKVFKIGNSLIIDNQEFIINTYRVHQEYDMITFKGITNINDILSLKGSLVYINKDLLNLNHDEYLDADLIDLEVYMNDNLVGKVSDIRYIIKNKKLLVINSSLVPFELVKKIDLKNKKIVIEEVSGLL